MTHPNHSRECERFGTEVPVKLLSSIVQEELSSREVERIGIRNLLKSTLLARFERLDPEKITYFIFVNLDSSGLAHGLHADGAASSGSFYLNVSGVLAQLRNTEGLTNTVRHSGR